MDACRIQQNLCYPSNYANLCYTTQVGRGAYAVVYKAKYKGSLVAIKVLLPKWQENEEGQELLMFLREAHYLSHSKSK
jgi:serine/threonine protein kinase